MISGDQVSLLPGLNVSRETLGRLECLSDLVLKWSVRINLIASSTAPEVWARHILDSAQIYPLAPDEWQTWIDLGTGGGFPGAVLAILALEKQPLGTFTFVESDQRKAVFLRTVVRECDLKARVLSSRAELTDAACADVLTARALGPLSDLLGMANRHLLPTGRALFPKGRRYKAEIAVARKNWAFDVTIFPSQTDAEGQILQIERLTHV